MRGKVIKITKVKDLTMGEPHNCHFNSAIYAIDNDCNFVCGWYYSGGKYPIAHCIVEKNGKYIDPTLNEGGKFKIFHTYTAEQICEIFNREGKAFIPFEGCININGESVVYNGMDIVSEDEMKRWWDYTFEMRNN